MILYLVFCRKDMYSGVSIDDIDKAINCPETWCSMSAVLDIAQEIEYLGNWCEACPCHKAEDALRITARALKRVRRNQPRGFRNNMGNMSCPYKGCRAVEMAAGKGQDSLIQFMHQGRDRIQEHFVAVPAERQAQLVADWDLARGRLWSNLAAEACENLYTQNMLLDF